MRIFENNLHVKLLTIILIVIFLTGSACALKLPEEDPEGDRLFTHPTVARTMEHYHRTIYILIFLLILSVGLNIFFGIIIMQFRGMIQTVAGAIDRIDILSKAVEETSKAWTSEQYSKIKSQSDKENKPEEEKEGKSSRSGSDDLVDMFVLGVNDKFGDEPEEERN